MYQDELMNSIGQLEQDLRITDKNRAGFLLQNDFKMVLLRNGGSLEQAEALIEQFRIGGSDYIDYVELLESMRSLAINTMTLPAQESSSSNNNGNTVDTGSISPFSDENDAVSGTVGFPLQEKRVSPVTGSTTYFLKSDSGNDDSQYIMTGPTKDIKRRDGGFYTSRSSASSRLAGMSVPEKSTIRRSVALPHHQDSATEKNRKQHEEKNRTSTHATRDVRTSGFVKYAVDRVSSTTHRASSVEKMVQQAKLRAFSEGSTSQQSETIKKPMMHEDSSEQRERNLSLLPNRERNNVSSAKRMQAGEVSVAIRNVVPTMKTTEDVTNSFSRGIHIDDRMVQHNISRVSHGPSTVGLSGRGDLISLREVFRVIDQNQDGIVTLREIWTALHRRGIEVHMPELEALADSLDLDESDMADTMIDHGDDYTIDRVLSSVDFCMLVSRMRSSLIQRIRRSSPWLAAAPEPSPPPVLPVSVFMHKGHGTIDKKRQHGSTKWNDNQSSASFLAECELTPSPQQSSSPRTSYKFKADVSSQDKVNSFSPPPSVHTSVTATHLAESGITGTPQGRSSAMVTTDHQPLSASTVFVSPSPEMETSRQPPVSMYSITMPPSSSRYAHVEKGTEMILAKGGKQSSFVASRSESPHPYDVPIARGLQQETEFSVPPSYFHPEENSSATRLMHTLGVANVSSSEKASGSVGKIPAPQDYAALHGEFLTRQKQRMEEEDFLKRLEMEFRERYAKLLNDTDPEPTHLQHSDIPDEMQTCSRDASSQCVKTHRVIVNPNTAKEDADEVIPRSASSSRANSPLNSNTGTVGRLFQHTASSLAHEKMKKIKYNPPKRTSFGQGSGPIIRKGNEKGSRGDVDSIDSLERRRRSFRTSEEPTSAARQCYTVQGEQSKQKQKSLATSVAGTPLSHSGSKKSGFRGGIRSVQPFSPSEGDVSTLSQHHHTNSMECRSTLVGTSGTDESVPAIVRVSLVPDASPLPVTAAVETGRVVRPSSTSTRNTCNGAKLSAQRQIMPFLGIPPVPPNRPSTVEHSSGKVDRVRHAQPSKSISEKLYGKCSRLLSLCSNYDRTQDGFLTPKDLGRALYAVSSDLTESEINELISMGLSQGGNGNRCHYVSLIGDLIVQESYVQLHKGSPEGNGSNNKDNRTNMEDIVNGTSIISSEHLHHVATPSSISRVSSVSASPRRVGRGGGGTEDSLLEDRVKKGKLKMNRLVREELLKGCGGDYHLLRNAFFAHDDIRTGYLEENVLRECLVRLFRTGQRLVPPWLLDRCVRLCRAPFEREMMAAAAAPGTKTTPAAAPPPDSSEEEAARRRVHGIPEVLWTVLCDYRYMLEELRL